MMTTLRPYPGARTSAEMLHDELARRRAAARRAQLRIRSAVRAAFWSAIAFLVWLGMSTIEDQRDGWWLLYGTAVLLLVATAVLVHVGSRGPRR